VILGSIAGLGLYDALNLCEFTLSSGSLRATGSNKSGSIDLHEGTIVFAEIDGRPAAGIHRFGVASDMWESVRADPGAGGRAVSALLDRGADPAEIRRFVRYRIEHVVAELAAVDGLHLDVVAETGWFGSELPRAIPEVIDAARVINFGGELIGDSTPDALIAMCPMDSGTISFGANEWTAIAELIGAVDLATLRAKLGNRRATELVRFLQARSLATAVVAMPTLE